MRFVGDLTHFRKSILMKFVLVWVEYLRERVGHYHRHGIFRGNKICLWVNQAFIATAVAYKSTVGNKGLKKKLLTIIYLTYIYI